MDATTSNTRGNASYLFTIEAEFRSGAGDSETGASQFLLFDEIIK
ncbi:hypothetical protein GXM_06531 [Nostoc sphaeroides CCNUC1]|uniref:Uncharacterized protein n=1 Tax=Nostoc sphaeroides CCNUC1 TaxID=2653204 RepID=A0A5P8W8B8_9NOSO|nr:hypothetical protein GXM_06531 [Nostoc sphaeroides CCNUC1]